jgi:hypothetical protein
MIGQIDIQNEIMKNIKIQTQKGNDFCADCNENHLCKGCKLSVMLFDLEVFLKRF